MHSTLQRLSSCKALTILSVHVHTNKGTHTGGHQRLQLVQLRTQAAGKIHHGLSRVAVLPPPRWRGAGPQGPQRIPGSSSSCPGSPEPWGCRWRHRPRLPWPPTVRSPSRSAGGAGPDRAFPAAGLTRPAVQVGAMEHDLRIPLAVFQQLLGHIDGHTIVHQLLIVALGNQVPSLPRRGTILWCRATQSS